MELPTRRFLIFFTSFFLCAVSGVQGFAQSADVSRAQTGMVTIRIGNLPETHTVPLAAYEALLSQGVQTTLVTPPADNQPFFRSSPATSTASGAEPLTMTGWKVGVFR